jgi:hypothetical protein
LKVRDVIKKIEDDDGWNWRVCEEATAISSSKETGNGDDRWASLGGNSAGDIQ